MTLDAERRQRLQDLFATGAGLAASERPAFVERSCGGDRHLQAELAELLEVQAAGIGEFLLTPAMARRRRAGQPSNETERGEQAR